MVDAPNDIFQRAREDYRENRKAYCQTIENRLAVGTRITWKRGRLIHVGTVEHCVAWSHRLVVCNGKTGRSYGIQVSSVVEIL